MNRTRILSLLTFLLTSVPAFAQATTSDECPTEINGSFRGENAGNVQDHMFHSIAIDPTNENIVYAGTETSGIFKSTDGGATWTRLRLGFKCTAQQTGYSQIFDIAIDPSNPQVLYTATINGPGPTSPSTFPSASGGVYKSTDGGLTWTQKNQGFTSSYVSYVIVDATNPSRVYAGVGGAKSSFGGSAFYDGGVWVSNNGGDSWSSLPLPPGVGTNILIDMVLRGTNQRTVFISGQSHGSDAPVAYGFVRSADGGQTWMVSNPAGQTISGFDAFKANPNIVYGHDMSTGRKIHKSTDGGTTWTQLQFGFFGVIRIHPTDSQVAYLTGQKSLLKTTNGFQTAHTEVYNDPDLPSWSQMVDIKISDKNPNVVWAAAKGYYLYKTANAGLTWTKITAIRDLIYGSPLSQTIPVVMSTLDSVTGIAVTNTDATSAVTVTLTSYQNDGSLTPASRNPLSIVVPPGAQTADLSSGLFGAGTSDDGGWVNVTANRPGIKGLFLNLDPNANTMDGAQFVNRPVNDFVFPEVQNADISLVNPNPAAIDVTIKLIGNEGAELASRLIVSIPPNGRYKARADTLFPVTATAADAYLRVSSADNFVAGEHFGVSGRFASYLSGLVADTGARYLYSPQYVFGFGYKSRLTLINLEHLHTNLRITWLSNNGSSLSGNLNVTLPPLGRTTITSADAFGVSVPEPGLEGYLVINSDTTRVTGAVQFGDPDDSTFQTTLPLVSSDYIETTYPHVASDETYFTGLAIINRNSAAANVTITIFDGNGVQVGSGQRVIAPNSKISELLNQIAPSLPLLSRGHFKIASDRPVYSFAIFGTNTLSVLSAIPAQN